MKKLLFLAVLSAAMMISCTGNQTNATDGQDSIADSTVDTTVVDTVDTVVVDTVF